MWNNLVSAYSNLIRPVSQGLSQIGSNVSHAVQNEVQQAPRQVSQGVSYAQHLAPQLPQIQIPRFQPLNIGGLASNAEHAISNIPLNIAGGILNPAINSVNRTMQNTNQALKQNRGNPFGAALQATGGLAKNTVLNPSVLADEASLAVPFGKGANLITKSILPGAISSGIYNVGQPGATPLSVAESTALGAGGSLIKLPNALNGAKTISKALKGYSPNAFNIHPDDQKVMSDFINAVQSGSGKADLGQLGKDAQVLAEHYIGKSAQNASNQKLAQAFDAMLSSAAKVRGEDALQTQFPSMGITANKNLKSNIQPKAILQKQLAQSNPLQNGEKSLQQQKGLSPLRQLNQSEKLQTSNKTIAQLQRETQSPDLTAYENAFNSGDTKTMNALAAKHPGDVRYQIHTNTPGSLPVGKERKFVTSVKGSSEVSPQVQGQVQGTYNPKANQVLKDASGNLISGKGLDQATSHVLGQLSQKGNIADQTVSDAIAVAKAHDQAGNFDQATNIYNQLAPKLTEAGRSVQAASLLSNRTPQGLLYSAVKTLQKNKVNVTPQISKIIEGLVSGIKQTGEGTPERNIATQKLVQFVNQNIPRSKTDAALGIWRAGLLTGPETVAKVAVSHAITTPFEMAAQIPAELADRMMSLVTGKRSLTATTQGFGSGLAQGGKAALSKLTSGLDQPGSGGFESDFGSHTTQTPYENFVGNVHGSLSKPTFNARYNVSLHDQALTEATNQGLKGAEKDAFVNGFVGKPSTVAKAIATKDAEIATNQQRTSIGSMASNLQNMKLGGVPVGKILAPFTRIPSAIGVNGLFNYTPFGIGAEVVRAVQSGKFDQRVMAQAFGRSATGTTVAALGALLGANGLMTLKAPADPKERALWAAQGKQPNSIKMGDKWISLNAFGPVGIVLGMGGGFGQALKSNGGDPVKATEEALAGGGRLLLDQPYLKGISGVANALNDPTRYGTTFFNNTAGSVVPAISSQIARGSDTVQRMNPKGVVDKFKAEIPGAAQTLPVQRDLFGKPLAGANPTGSIPGAIAGTVNPFYPASGKSDPVSTELQRLYDTLGSSGSPSIGQPLANQTINGQKVKLTNQQLSDYVASRGPQVQQGLSSLISSPDYQALTDEEKTNAINSVLTGINNQTKASIAGQPVSSTQTPGGSIGNKIFYNENGKAKSVDLTPPHVGSGIDAFTNQDWKYTKAREVFKSPLPDATKQQAYQQLGVDPSRVEYDYKAAHSDTIKTQYVAAKAPTESHSSLIQDLVNGRVQSQSGKLFASNGVLDGLAQQGVISLDEAKALKTVEYNPTGQNIGTSSKLRGGRGRTRVTPIAKVPTLKTVKPKLTRIKTLSLPKVHLASTKLKSTSLKVTPIAIKRVSRSAKLT